MNGNMTIIEVAKILHVDQATVRAGLISKDFPFGVAIKCSKNYTYIIPEERFKAWYEARDLKGANQ